MPRKQFTFSYVFLADVKKTGPSSSDSTFAWWTSGPLCRRSEAKNSSSWKLFLETFDQTSNTKEHHKGHCIQVCGCERLGRLYQTYSPWSSDAPTSNLAFWAANQTEVNAAVTVVSLEIRVASAGVSLGLRAADAGRCFLLLFVLQGGMNPDRTNIDNAIKWK